MLFSPGSVSSIGEGNAGNHDEGAQSEEMAPGTTVEISVEGYADDICMLALCAMTPMMMLLATGQWTTLMGQEINVKKSLAFAVQHKARGTKEAQDVELKCSNEDALCPNNHIGCTICCVFTAHSHPD